jgi:hypothetical protein
VAARNTPVKQIVEHLDSKLGLTIQRGLDKHYDFQVEANREIDLLYNRIRALWHLCISVGATLCKPETNLHQSAAKNFLLGSS